MVRYLDPFYGTDITESVLYKLASLHRSEIIKDFEDGSVFRITYSYVTRRGQTRVHEKFIFSLKIFSIFKLSRFRTIIFFKYFVILIFLIPAFS